MEKNLIFADELMRDMVAYPKELGNEIEAFVLTLADNSAAPDILTNSHDYHDGSFSHQLPSGCVVFWEIPQTETHPRFGSLDGIFVRVTGAKFDFPPK